MQRRPSRPGQSRLLFTLDLRRGEDGAKAERRFGKPRINVIGKLLVVGMDRIVAQNRQVDPKRIVVDNAVPECRAKTCPGRGAYGVVLLFEICLEKFPAQLERNLEPLNRSIPHDRVFRQGKDLIKAHDARAKSARSD